MRVFKCGLILVMICVMESGRLSAQELDTWNGAPEVTFSGFVDVFYVYDFNKPDTDYRQKFFFNHNRHNEFNINLGLLRTQVNHDKYRASLGLQVGTYAIDNYASESEVMRHIYEAYAGISLNKKNNLWIDAGIFGSHLGFESAISIDNLTLTRSLAAENSPYFLTGAKITYEPNEHWTYGFTIANGWQRIRRLPGNSMPSFGTQINYHVGDDLQINWSTLIGTDDPDSTRRVRVFNNLYSTFTLSEKVNMIAGFDIGIQQESKGSSGYHTWWTPVAIIQIDLNEKWATAFRAEYFGDENEVIISSESTVGFSTAAFSANIDYVPMPELACRLETRWLTSSKNVYAKDDSFIGDNFFIVASIAIRFHK